MEQMLDFFLGAKMYFQCALYDVFCAAGNCALLNTNMTNSMFTVAVWMKLNSIFFLFCMFTVFFLLLSMLLLHFCQHVFYFIK